MNLLNTSIAQDIVEAERGSFRALGRALRKILAYLNDFAGTNRKVSATAATLSITSQLHNGKTVALDRAAGGVTVTLPASTGGGDKYRFRIVTALSSGNYIIKVANSTDVFRGTVIQTADGGNTLAAYDTAATDDTITLNGSTAGGLPGDIIEFEDLKAGFWEIMAITVATGVEASPLSATV